MEGNRYMEPESSAVSCPPYSGYGAPNYGYGARNNWVDYGGYATFSVGGYAYGMSSALKNNWGSRPSNYTANTGYQNHDYGFGGYGRNVDLYSDGPGTAGRHGGNNLKSGTGNGAAEEEEHASAGKHDDANSEYGNKGWSQILCLHGASGCYGCRYGDIHSRQAPYQ